MTTRKQTSETDCLASSAVAHLRLERVVLLWKKIPVVGRGKGTEKKYIGEPKSERMIASNRWRPGCEKMLIP